MRSAIYYGLVFIALSLSGKDWADLDIFWHIIAGLFLGMDIVDYGLKIIWNKQ